LIALLKSIEIREEKKEAPKGSRKGPFQQSDKKQWEKEAEEADKESQDTNLPTFIQQAHAAKLLG
jgi:hypothetical protein